MANFLRNPIYWLLPFIPLSWYLQHLGDRVSADLKFSYAALALIPLAALFVESTKQIAYRLGDMLGELLNATFGNAPALIISLVTLKAGLLDIVKASIVDVILTNLLFVLGLSLLVGGLYHGDQKFNRRGVRIERSVLMIAAISIVIPSVFDHLISPEAYRHEMALNAGVALVFTDYLLL